MEINVISGALYTQDGKKIADVKDPSIMLVDEPYKQRTMEVAENIGKTHSITCQLAPYDMRMVYSLMYGMKITNNFLKMHGGIMVRNAANLPGFVVAYPECEKGRNPMQSCEEYRRKGYAIRNSLWADRIRERFMRKE